MRCMSAERHVAARAGGEVMTVLMSAIFAIMSLGRGAPGALSLGSRHGMTEQPEAAPLMSRLSGKVGTCAHVAGINCDSMCFATYVFRR